jgi:hypothetical protein
VAKQRKDDYDSRGHRFERIHCSSGSIALCDNCGLVPLHNDLSQLAVKLGCFYKEHPTFQQAMKRFRLFT